MTKPAYPSGWPARSKVRGRAPSPGDCAWYVNFNNGNANWKNHDNDGFVRAVRAGECHSVPLADLYTAWREARRGKHPSRNQLAFDTFWMDGLLELQAELAAGTWRPRPPTDARPRPLSAGIDFLGYVVRPTHTVVRRRVVHHARQALRGWQQKHVRPLEIIATPTEYRGLRSCWMSYAGHFAHAASASLHARIHAEFPWLRRALLERSFDHRLEGLRCSLWRGSQACR